MIETYATSTLRVNDRLVLVDTATEDDSQQLLDYLAKINIMPRDLSTIFITHTHHLPAHRSCRLEGFLPQASSAAKGLSI